MNSPEPSSPSIFSFGVWMSAIAGILVWLLITAYAARHDAWGAPVYYTVGMPLLALMAAALAYSSPERPWRYAVAPYVGQALIGFLLNPTGGVFPLGIILFPILCVPGLVFAYLAAALKAGLLIKSPRRLRRRRIAERDTSKMKVDDLLRELEEEAEQWSNPKVDRRKVHDRRDRSRNPATRDPAPNGD